MPSGDRRVRVRCRVPWATVKDTPVVETRMIQNGLGRIVQWLIPPEKLHRCGSEGEQDTDNRQHRGIHRGFHAAQLADL